MFQMFLCADSMILTRVEMINPINHLELIKKRTLDYNFPQSKLCVLNFAAAKHWFHLDLLFSHTVIDVID